MKLRIILIAIFIAAAVASCTVTPVPVVPSIETVVTPTSCTSGVPLAVLGGKYIKGKSNYYAYHTSTVADASGNSYSAGLYSGDVDFGGTRLSGKGGYLSKSDRTGKFTWVVKLPVAYSYTATFASGKIFVQTYDYVNDKPVRTLCTYTTDGVLLSTVEIKGGVYFDDAGNSYYSEQLSNGLNLQKRNAGGTVAWSKIINSDTEVSILKLRVANNGSISMMIRSYRRIVITTNYLDHFIKLDANGTVVYDNTTPEVNYAEANQLPFCVIDAAGNYYTTAKSENILQKYNASGNLAWAQKYPRKQTVTGVSVDNAGNIYAIGNLNGTILNVAGTSIPRNVPTTLYLMKLNAAGDGQWGYFLNLPLTQPDKIAFDSNNFSQLFAELPGNLFVTGYFAKRDYANTTKLGYDFFSIRYKICQ